MMLRTCENGICLHHADHIYVVKNASTSNEAKLMALCEECAEKLKQAGQLMAPEQP